MYLFIIFLSWTMKKGLEYATPSILRHSRRNITQELFPIYFSLCVTTWNEIMNFCHIYSLTTLQMELSDMTMYYSNSYLYQLKVYFHTKKKKYHLKTKSLYDNRLPHCNYFHENIKNCFCSEHRLCNNCIVIVIITNSHTIFLLFGKQYAFLS